MTKTIFLQRLERALKSLPPQERDEIIRDYAAHFDEALAEGRGMEETAEALGEPEILAAEYLAGRADAKQPFLVSLLGKLARPCKSPANPIERVLAWTPGTDMTISVPVEVHWKPAQTARAVIRGDAWVIEHLRLESDGLHGRMKWPFARKHTVRLELESPAIGTWKLIGSGALHLHEVSQETLELSVEGSGDIFADGRATDVRIAIAGTGEIDIGALEQKNTTATVTGMGDATIAPTEQAKLTISGNGDIRLMTEPARLEADMSGGGDIRLANGSLLKK